MILLFWRTSAGGEGNLSFVDGSKGLNSKDDSVDVIKQFAKFLMMNKNT